MEKLDQNILSQLPTPLVDAYQAFEQEDANQPFRKIHRLIDLIEVFCKIYTVGSMATFLDALQTQLEKQDALDEESLNKVKVMLAAGLKTPSLGIWWMFARDITKIMKELSIPHILNGAEEELLNGKSLIKKAFDGENNLISFRNGYAHGATPTDKACQADLNQIWPRMLKILTEAKSLQSINILICKDDQTFHWVPNSSQEMAKPKIKPKTGHTWFCFKDRCIDVYPLFSFNDSDERLDFFFYNDYKEKYANYLNYPNAIHHKDADLKRELLEYIPINEWKKIGSVELDPFKQQVDLLTEVFKGRKKELNQIASFISEENNQFLCIWGPPGVGKSALLARSSQILRYNPEVREVLEEGHQWPEQRVYLVDYFIRRGSTDTANDFFDSVNLRLDAIFNLRLSLGKNELEKKAMFEARLKEVSKKIKSDEVLLFIFDGLDEIKSDDPLLSMLPRLVPPQIKVIYGARPQQSLKFSFYDQLFREGRNQFDLTGLSEEDIFAVLMEHVNKYAIEAKYVKEVAKRSEGNPLYLKMLCQGLEQQIYELNNANVLPKEMSTLYENALLRLEKEQPGSIHFLLFLAAAKDFVSVNLMASWMEKGTTEVANTFLFACLEFLYENPLTENIEDYQLFHESLREYLTAKYSSELQKCKERICDWGFQWKDEQGDLAFENEQLLYAMSFTSEHLYENYLHQLKANKTNQASHRRNQLFSLGTDESWRSVSFTTSGNGDAIKRSYYFLQKITVQEDVDGARLEDFFNYSLNRYLEPQKMYEDQRMTLKKPIKKDAFFDHLEKTPALAKMGEKDEERILLALLPMWSNTHEIEIPASYRQAIDKWMENNRSTAVKKLWQQTLKQRN